MRAGFGEKGPERAPAPEQPHHIQRPSCREVGQIHGTPGHLRQRQHAEQRLRLADVRVGGRIVFRGEPALGNGLAFEVADDGVVLGVHGQDPAGLGQQAHDRYDLLILELHAAFLVGREDLVGSDSHPQQGGYGCRCFAHDVLSQGGVHAEIDDRLAPGLFDEALDGIHQATGLVPRLDRADVGHQGGDPPDNAAFEKAPIRSA